MNTQRDVTSSRNAYVRKQLRNMRPQAGLSQVARESGQYAGDLGRQLLLGAGLLLLVLIMLAATTGNQTFARLICWTGWFNN